MKGDQDSVFEYKKQRTVDYLMFFIQVQNARSKKEILIIVFQLASLIGIAEIFDYQGVNLKKSTNLLYQARGIKATNIDPYLFFVLREMSFNFFPIT